MPSDIKSEVIELLEPIFGKDFVKTVTNLYDEQESEEIIKLAHNMLTGYLGEEAANQILSKLLKKHPELEKKALAN